MCTLLYFDRNFAIWRRFGSPPKADMVSEHRDLPRRMRGPVLDEMPTILLVEDEEAIQDFVRDALGDAGFDLTVSASAEEALVLLRSGVVQYRALVTDIQIEGKLSGWELARKVREIEPDFPVVYMTGAAADQWTSQGVPNSILLQKPFAPAQLVTAISQLLNVGGPGLA